MSTNVLLAKFRMTSASFHSLPVSTTRLQKLTSSSFFQKFHTLQFVVLITIIFSAFAGFIAPEKPHQFASICEKHNSISACEVW